MAKQSLWLKFIIISLTLSASATISTAQHTVNFSPVEIADFESDVIVNNWIGIMPEIGTYYYNGNSGWSKDIDKSIFWFNKSASQGDNLPACALATIYAGIKYENCTNFQEIESDSDSIIKKDLIKALAWSQICIDFSQTFILDDVVRNDPGDLSEYINMQKEYCKRTLNYITPQLSNIDIKEASILYNELKETVQNNLKKYASYTPPLILTSKENKPDPFLELLVGTTVGMYQGQSFKQAVHTTATEQVANDIGKDTLIGEALGQYASERKKQDIEGSNQTGTYANPSNKQTGTYANPTSSGSSSRKVSTYNYHLTCSGSGTKGNIPIERDNCSSQMEKYAYAQGCNIVNNFSSTCRNLYQCKVKNARSSKEKTSFQQYLNACP